MYCDNNIIIVSVCFIQSRFTERVIIISEMRVILYFIIRFSGVTFVENLTHSPTIKINC